MKKFVFILSLVMVLGFTTLSNAALQDNGNNLIYDTDLNITWYDPLPIQFVDWIPALTWAAGLTVGGTTAGSWRLPTTPGTKSGYTAEGEMGHLYYYELGNPSGYRTNVGPFTHLGNVYWSSTQSALYPEGALAFFFNNGSQGACNKDYPLYAMAVHPGNIGAASVPEPATMLLLGLGLAGLAGVRRKFKK